MCVNIIILSSLKNKNGKSLNSHWFHFLEWLFFPSEYFSFSQEDKYIKSNFEYCDISNRGEFKSTSLVHMIMYKLTFWGRTNQIWLILEVNTK